MGIITKADQIKNEQEALDKRINALPRLQKKVYRYLMHGGKYTAADLSSYLRLCDPRGYIAALRDKGFEICDDWIESETGTRCKVYYLPKH